MKVAVKIHRTLRHVPLPEYHTSGAAGFDLAPAFDVDVPPGQTVPVRTGLVVVTPPNHMLLIAPRSSTWKKYSIRLGNTVGIVDEDYAGAADELLLSLYNAGQFVTKIKAGTRLAQGVFVPITRAEFVEVDRRELPGNRGGWGSTS